MELTVNLPQGDQRFALTGVAERNLKLIRERMRVSISARNGTLKIRGDSDAVGRAAKVLERLAGIAEDGFTISPEQVIETIESVGAPRHPEPVVDKRASGDEPALDPTNLEVYLHGRNIKPSTPGQKEYVKAVWSHDLTLCSGPAGTGKTYLAVAAAVGMLKRGIVRRLVLVRPAVEAGEKLGFLPGSMQEKVNPYVRPLLDALHDMMEFEQVQRFMANDVIEIVPLAFMRGRTLNDALIILDEAQNSTRAQMLMFLTRLGHGSKMIVTGDTSQIDLERPEESGLIDAARRLRRVRGVAMVTLTQQDIVRHSLVQRVIEAYGKEHPAGAGQELQEQS